MATQTPKYKLIKQGQEDYYNVDILNGNMDLIDTALKEQGETIGEVSSQLAAIADDYTKQIPYAGATTGAANTYAIAAPVITALTSGMAVCVKIHIASTGASTLNWNGKGAKGIKKSGGADATNLKANGIYTLRYDGTSFILQGEGASGNATASDLLSGKTATTDAGDITGTMPDYRGVDTTPHSVNGVTGGIYVQPKTGAYNQVGAVFVEDPDFIPANFLATKNVFGLQGSISVIGGSSVAGTLVASTPGDGTIRVMPPIGYYDGSTGVIYIYNADYIPANILTGKSPFGLAGTAKRVASGTASAVAASNFALADGSNYVYLSSIAVSGLNFTPSKIILHRNDVGDNYEYTTIYRKDGRYYSNIALTSINSPGQTNASNLTFKADVAPAYVNSTGFNLPVRTNGTWDWVAIE